MGIYIIRPKQTLVERSLALAAVGMTPESREAQVTEIARLRAEDPAYQEIRHWINDYQGSRSKVAKEVSVPIPVEVSTAAPAAAEAVAGAAAAVAQAVIAASTVEVIQTESTTQRRKGRTSREIGARGSLDRPKVREAVITGTIIVDMSDEAATRMRRELPDVLILRDEPMDLIPPKRLVTTAQQKVSASDLWHLRAIGLESARKNGFRGSGAGITIAVLDTGIDPNHTELSGKVTEAFTFDTNLDVWEAQPMIPSADTHGHGTHVAGLICGKTVGVAPGAQLLSGVMIPRGRGMVSDFVLALEWAASRPEVQIVNMSAGIPGYLPEMHEALEGVLRAGALPIFAIGNEGRNKTRSPGNYIEPIAVGAADRRDRIYSVASFSGGGTLIVDNHQYQKPDLVGPGKEVFSSVQGGGYEAWSGTSMATPIVSGVAALILEKYPNLTLLELEDELFSTCRSLGLPPIARAEGSSK